MADDTYDDGESDKVGDSVSDDNASDTKDTTYSSSNSEGGDVKVPEAFQKEAMALVSQCSTIPCLDFLMSEVGEQRMKIMSSQKKSGLNSDKFSSEDMPSSD